MNDILNPIKDGAKEQDNLVLFPSAKNFPLHEGRNAVQDLIEDWEALEAFSGDMEEAQDEEVSDELTRAGADVMNQDPDGLNLSEILSLTQMQINILKETGERIDYLIREIESVLPRRK